MGLGTQTSSLHPGSATRPGSSEILIETLRDTLYDRSFDDKRLCTLTHYQLGRNGGVGRCFRRGATMLASRMATSYCQSPGSTEQALVHVTLMPGCHHRNRELHTLVAHLMTSAVLLRFAVRHSLPRFQSYTTSLRVVNLSRTSLLCRYPRHLSSQSTAVFVKPQLPSPNDRNGGPKNGSAPAEGATVQDQRKKDWNIVRKMMEHMWPQDWGVRGRVLLGLGLLVGGKVNRASNSTAFLLNTHGSLVAERSSSCPI